MFSPIDETVSLKLLGWVWWVVRDGWEAGELLHPDQRLGSVTRTGCEMWFEDGEGQVEESLEDQGFRAGGEKFIWLEGEAWFDVLLCYGRLDGRSSADKIKRRSQLNSLPPVAGHEDRRGRPEAAVAVCCSSSTDG